MPAYAHGNEAMQNVTGVSYQTRDQHKDTSIARQNRDVSDTLDLMNYFTDHIPFTENNNLFSISNGITAHPWVDLDNSKEKGEHIIQMMVGKSADDFTFRRINQAITLADKSAIKIRGEEIKVDPQFIFQRLATVGERTEELASIFKYELCTYPPALFDSSGLPLEANKAVLGGELWK